jgi:hypothetical protein
VTLACANLFVGIITTVTTFVLENFDDEELKAIGSVLKVHRVLVRKLSQLTPVS